MKKIGLIFSIPSGVKLSAVLQRPENYRALFFLGHGSGSNMNGPHMRGLADALFERGIATLRFQYPYSQHPAFIPFTDMPVDDDQTLIDTMRAACALANEMADGVPIYVGGHSMSGFVATLAAAQTNLHANGIVVLAYPRKGDPTRSAHLARVVLPLLIVQGTKDPLGTPAEILEMVELLLPSVRLTWLEGASHVLTVADLDQSIVLHTAVDHICDFVDSI
jgi:predicted alpha/beta-hydrolase family hydrolase